MRVTLPAPVAHQLYEEARRSNTTPREIILKALAERKSRSSWPPDDARLTREQAAIIGAYTGFTAGPFADVHQLAEEVLGRPFFTHEFANSKLATELREAIKPRYLEICYDPET